MCIFKLTETFDFHYVYFLSKLKTLYITKVYTLLINYTIKVLHPHLLMVFLVIFLTSVVILLYKLNT